MRTEDLERRILAGGKLHMGFADGETTWWIEDPYARVSEGQVSAVMQGPNGSMRLVEAGDCLFGWSGNSQTWVSVYA